MYAPCHEQLLQVQLAALLIAASVTVIVTVTVEAVTAVAEV
jgi:hypothetical protein